MVDFIFKLSTSYHKSTCEYKKLNMSGMSKFVQVRRCYIHKPILPIKRLVILTYLSHSRYLGNTYLGT